MSLKSTDPRSGAAVAYKNKQGDPYHISLILAPSQWAARGRIGSGSGGRAEAAVYCAPKRFVK